MGHRHTAARTGDDMDGLVEYRGKTHTPVRGATKRPLLRPFRWAWRTTVERSKVASDVAHLYPDVFNEVECARIADAAIEMRLRYPTLSVKDAIGMIVEP